MENTKMGKITSQQRGLLRVWSCSCPTPAVEVEEGMVVCIKAQHHGLNGCGQTKFIGGV